MSNGLKFNKQIFSIKAFYFFIGLAALSIITFIIFSPYIPYSIKLQKGEIAPETIISPRYIEFESSQDKVHTQNLRKERAQLVAPIYSVNENINKNVQLNIVNFFTQAKKYRTEKEKNPKLQIPNDLSFISDDKWQLLNSLDMKTFNSLEYISLQSTEKILNQGIKKINIPIIRNKILKNIAILELGKKLEDCVVTIILHYIRPNFTYDTAKTTALIGKEVESIKPFSTTLKEGEPIVYKGEALTNTHIEILTALNIYGTKANFIKYIGIFLYCLLLLLVLERFIYYFYARIHEKLSTYLVIFFITLLVLLIARIFHEYQDIRYIGNLQFLIPIPIVAMIISLLVTHNIAMLTGTIVAILIALMYQGNFYLFLYLFLSSCIAAFATYKAHKRIDLIKAGNIVGLFNIFIVISIGILLEINDFFWFLANSGVAFANGLISAMLSMAIRPYLEGIFKITTSLSLLEHANLSHPLLKKLMVTAPGTYQHSLMVANLAEAAAEAINCDVVLTRIGSYFHDIGKMKRPSFFIENQFSEENPHETLQPRISKIIISAHAKDGLEIAQKNKLPKILQDFIIQHHGTTMVSFFYSRAKQTEETAAPKSMEEEFRYPGPKPQFKESGIVMLADCVEAALRSIEKPTMPKIENLINKVFKDKLDDNQLNECPLSLKEIQTIQQTFLGLFKGIYHSRLDYQEEIAQIIEQTRQEKSKEKGKSAKGSVSK